MAEGRRLSLYTIPIHRAFADALAVGLISRFGGDRLALAQGIEAANAQEREAYAHPEYQELLQGLAAAIEVEERLKWHLEAAKMRTDIWRTEEASNRATDRAAQ